MDEDGVEITGDEQEAWFAAFESGELAVVYDCRLQDAQRMLARMGMPDASES